METLRNLKVEQGNPDLWMEAASLYMGLGDPERAFQCTQAATKIEVERREDDDFATRLGDELRRELGQRETVPCPNCDTLLELGSTLCHICSLELQG